MNEQKKPLCAGLLFAAIYFICRVVISNYFGWVMLRAVMAETSPSVSAVPSKEALDLHLVDMPDHKISVHVKGTLCLHAAEVIRVQQDNTRLRQERFACMQRKSVACVAGLGLGRRRSLQHAVHSERSLVWPHLQHDHEGSAKGNQAAGGRQSC